MKKCLLIIAYLSTLIACEKIASQEIEAPESPETPVIPTTEEVIPTVFYAYTESYEPTKTTLQDDGEGAYDIVWSSADRILVKGGSYEATYRPETESTSSNLVFYSGYSLSAPYTAFYPNTIYNTTTKTTSSPIELTLTNGTLSEFPMYAESTTTDLAFKNLFGVLRLRLSGSSDIPMGKVVISTDEPLAGSFDIVADGSAWKAVSTGLNKLTVNVSGSTMLSTGYDLWIPIPAGSYNNLSIKVYKGDNTSYSLKTAKSAIEVQRSKISTINLTTLTLDTPVASLLGAGTEEDPYQISSEADVDLLRELVDLGNTFYGKYFKVMNDFTITKPHVPIGSIALIDFDGNDKTITLSSGFDFSTTPEKAGFFSELTRSGSPTIHNLTITGPDVTISAAESANLTHFGTFVGLAYTSVYPAVNGIVKNCVNNIDITINGGTKTLYAGGIAGVLYDITDCSNTGNISVNYSSNSVSAYIGGICGRTNWRVLSCSNSGNITFTGSASYGTGSVYVGGISGYSSTAQHNGNTGSVSASSRTNKPVAVGGITASLGAYSCYNCFNTGIISADNAAGTNLGVEVGGIVGNNNSAKIYNCFSTGSVSGRNYSSTYVGSDYRYYKPCVGGIAGYKGEVYNCYSSGEVHAYVGNGGESYLSGGILGMTIAKSNVQHCYFWGEQFAQKEHNAIGLYCPTADDMAITSGTHYASETNNVGVNCSGFGSALTTYHIYTNIMGTEFVQGKTVTINETDYPAAEVGQTPILTLLNAGRAVYETSSGYSLLPWKAGTGDPAYPVFDE